MKAGARLKKFAGPAFEVGVVHPAPVDHHPVEVILEHLLRRPGDAALARRESAIEVDAVFLLEVQPDERGVRDDGAVVIDERQLALRRAQKPLVFVLVFQLRKLEQHLRLHHEGTGIGQSEGRAEGVQRDHSG